MKSGRVVSERLAAVLQHRQIEAIVRAETVADETQKAIEALAQEAVAIAIGLRSYRAPSRRVAVAERLKAMPETAVATLTDFMTRLGVWSHQEAVKGLAKTIPRSWWFSTGVERATEAAGDLPAPVVRTSYVNVGGILSGATQIPSLAGIVGQIQKGKLEQVSDEQWEELTAKLLFPSPSPEEVRRIVLAPNPQTGESWTERLSGLSREIDDPDAVASQLISGFSSGENVQELYKRVLPLTNGIQASARRVARTEGLRVAEEVQRKSWDFLGDLMVGTQILAVLDQNTRPEHASRSGTVFYKSPKPGQKSIAELPSLPDAPNCRCWSAPVLTEPDDAEKNAELQQVLADNEKNSIPDPSAYLQWFRGADEGRRKLAVGTRRYEAVAKQLPTGESIEWTDFIGEDGQLLPIDDIRNETPAQRATRKANVREMLARREELVRQVARQGFVAKDRTADPLPPPPEPPTPAPPVVLSWERKERVRDINRAIVDLGIADRADFGAVHPEIANAWSETLVAYRNEFPELAGRLQFVGSIQARNRLLPASERDPLTDTGLGRWYGDRSSKVAGIAIDERAARSPAELSRILRRDVRIGHSPRHCDSPRFLIDHEMAHELESYLGLARGSEPIPELRAIFGGRTHDEISVHLSEYANQGYSEAIAEAWGEWKCSPEPRQMARQVGELIERLIRQKRGNTS